MNVHFIAIGGSAMHNLAIALHHKGYNVSGSDDEVFEPSRSRLKNLGLLPEQEGWFPERITPQLDAVILGMHARADNPELLKAKETGLKIFSYPEYLYEQSVDKVRIVIGGSHGKTTITAMILHVFKHCGVDCDYMVGAQLEGFDVMVRLTGESRYMIFEGDEYLTSPIDRRPKFHLYHPHIALISGIAWDHINVFPTFENYVDQFRTFIHLIQAGGKLIYCHDDDVLSTLAKEETPGIVKMGYSLPEHATENGITSLVTDDGNYPLKVFGKHNLLNINGARLICNQAGISDAQFYEAIQGFKGASKRLEILGHNDDCAVYKDFAHSPSKLDATTQAVKQQFPGRTLVACMELHTFSSLSKGFLSHYKGCMDEADVPVVYFSPHALDLKKLPPLTEEEVKEGFGNPTLKIFTDSLALRGFLLAQEWKNKNLLMMSSGDFDGLKLNELADTVLSIH